MKSKELALKFTATIFGIVAILHLLRVITDATVIIDGWSLLVWVNVLGFIATAFLSVVLWWLSLDKDIK